MSQLSGNGAATLFLAICVCALVGCSGGSSSSIFDEIAQMPSREELVEVSMGAFIIPIPVVLESAIERFEADNLMQIELELFAVVDPDEASQVELLLEQHKGRIRDSVIQVCRSTTRDDLLETQKATLKAHLLDAVQPMIGGTAAVRRIGIKRVIIDEL